MNQQKAKRLLLWVLAGVCLLLVMIGVIASPQFREEKVTGDAVNPTLLTGELVDGMILRQRIEIPMDEVQGIQLMAGCYGRENTGLLHVSIEDENGNNLSAIRIPVENLQDASYTTLTLDEPLSGLKGKAVFLTFTTEGCSIGNAVTLYNGSSVSTGRIDLNTYIAPEDYYTLNGVAGVGRLCIKLSGVNHLSFYRYYWPIAAVLVLLLVLVGRKGYLDGLNGKTNLVSTLCIICDRYSFLVKQLVSRDFKTKYKRSVLGVAWSFLNPLLSMVVQYIVFSTLFKSNIENYPVYLLTGIVFWSFFNEACSIGLSCITDNAPLIKKVYLPKYVYPLSRVLSSLVNFGFSLIPLFGVILLTGTRLHLSFFLLLYDVLCYAMFVLGMVMILSTMMTFFQDTRFIWSVLSMIWMYLTPIFYPESIIPTRFATLYHMNPLYQFVNFARICITDGVSPGPSAYLWCLLCGAFVMGLGIWLFHRHQDQFVLNL